MASQTAAPRKLPRHPTKINNPTQTTAIDAKQTLHELGILLLEIWHQEPFESRLPSSIVTATGNDARPLTSGSYYQRLAAAIEWLDDTTDPIPEQYDRAASLCIRGVIGGDSRLADWDDMAFWTAMCADVIEPLQRNCRPWQRGGGLG
jgi:hypothetical protein